MTVLFLAVSCQKELPDGFDNYVVNKGTQDQAMSPEISLDTNSLEFTAESGSKAFNIKSNTSWTVSSDKSWCTVSPSSGSNNRSLTVKVEANTSTSSRTATITVRSERSEVGNLTIKVTQDATNATISLDTDAIGFASSSSETTFMITSNTSWTVSSDQSWCSVSPSSGNNNGTVTIKVSENTSTSFRNATITVGAESIMRHLSVYQSGAEAPASQDRNFTVGGVQFKMIYVEGGTFTMGAMDGDSDAADQEKPAHTVTLSNYSIGETEVTQALWQAVMGQKPTSDGPQWNSTYGLSDNHPAYYVSWNDCQEFISKLNAITGENFRLPTEAEWEKAAGYGDVGVNKLGDVAWMDTNSKGGTQTVATKQASKLGLYDMLGNVWEWCQDWYGSYSSSSQVNPVGPASGSGRVCRGGSWSYDAWDCRVTRRFGGDPDVRSKDKGLRLVL